MYITDSGMKCTHKLVRRELDNFYSIAKGRVVKEGSNVTGVINPSYMGWNQPWATMGMVRSLMLTTSLGGDDTVINGNKEKIWTPKSN